MRHGCSQRCPKVREHFQKSRERADEARFEDVRSSQLPRTSRSGRGNAENRDAEREKNYRRSKDDQRRDERRKKEISNNVPTHDRTTNGNPGRERGRGKNREYDDGAGPSRTVRGGKNFGKKFDDYEDFEDDHKLCDPNCRGINERPPRAKNEEEKRILDEYLVDRGLPYFGDLCACSFRCLVKQIWNDKFASSTVASFTVFAMGLKLFSDLDGWTVPNTL